MSATNPVEDDDSRRSRVERSVLYSRRSHELHTKYYRRLSLLLAVLSLIGLSAPLVKALGGDNTPLAIGAALLFLVFQAIDWRMAPGELGGQHAAKAREFHRLASRAKKLTTDELEDAWDELCDNDLPENEHVRQIAFVNSAQEQGYLSDIPDEDKKLSRWERFLWGVLKF